VPTSPGGQSDAPTVIGAACAQIVLPRKTNRPTMTSSREHLGILGVKERGWWRAPNLGGGDPAGIARPAARRRHRGRGQPSIETRYYKTARKSCRRLASLSPCQHLVI